MPVSRTTPTTPITFTGGTVPANADVIINDKWAVSGSTNPNYVDGYTYKNYSTTGTTPVWSLYFKTRATASTITTFYGKTTPTAADSILNDQWDDGSFILVQKASVPKVTGNNWTKNGALSTFAGITTGNTTLNSNGVTTGNTTVSSNGVTTGNTTVSSDGITTGNTSVTSNGITTGNTSVTSNGITAGNTTVTDTGITTGNTAVTANGITTGNTSISNAGITTGNTSITSNAITTNTISTGNTTVTSNGVTTGNTAITSNGVTTGNTTVSSNGVTTGNTTITGNTITTNTISTGNTTVTDTGITTGNTAVTSNGVTTGNTAITSNGVTTGNTTITGNTITTNTISTGNTTVTSNGVTTGNTTVSSNGVTTGNTSVTSNGVTTGNTAITSNGVTTGNTTITGNTITTNTISTGNTTVTSNGVTTGNTTVSSNGVTTGNTTVSSNGVTTGNTTVSSNGVTTGNTTVSSNGVTTGNTTVSSNGVTTGNTTITGNTITTNTISTGNTTVTSNGVTTGNTTVSSNGVTTGNTSITSNGITTGNTSITSNSITANYFIGNGYYLTGIDTTRTANYANYAGIVVDNVQPNITSVGTLTTLSVSGDATITGNLTISGSTTFVNSTITKIVDPIIELGGGANDNALVGNDGKDRGELLHYYTDKPVKAFMGWDSSNSEFAFGSNVSVTNEVVGFNTLGNVRAEHVFANINGSNVIGQVANANVATTITANAQPNITSVGTLANLTVNGLANLGNISNIKVGGGLSGYVLTTDGLGNLSWAVTGNAVLAGNGTGEIQFYDNASNNLGASANLRFDVTSKSLIVDNVQAKNEVKANYFIGDGSNLTNLVLPTNTAITNANISNANIINATITTATITTANISTLNVSNGANLGNIGNLRIFGGSNSQYLTTDGNGNLSWSNIASGKAAVISNITSVVAGGEFVVTTDYSNLIYPAGIFTFNQLGPVSLTASDIWTGIGTSKNAYANFIANTANATGVSLTLSLANANFAISASDTITIGSTTITGSNITGLNITGTGGTYLIPNTYLNFTTLTQSSDSVSVTLTTNRGTKSASGTTLTNIQPVPFNVNALAGTFTAATVPYWNLNQSFNWNATVTSGATNIIGNVTYTQVGNASVTGSLTSNGQITSTSVSLNSSYSYTITSSDYTGDGGAGAGRRTIPSTVTGTVNAATKYYPLFYKITSNSTVPTFTTSDSRNSNNYATGQGATTNNISSNYLWIAIPNSPSNSSSLASRTFKHIFGGFDIVDTPAVTGTQAIASNSETYNYSIYGFTGFSATTFILTTS